MEKRTSAAARLFAALALVVAVVIVVVVASAALNGSDDEQRRSAPQRSEQQNKDRTKAKSYTVESGDTLTAIARKTGVPVAEILALNPEVDPQILIAGQTLKLK